MLSREDQSALFTLVRETIRAHLLKEPTPDCPTGSSDLEQVRGVFVTLRLENGDLRGCIGHTVGQLPLAESVRKLAVSAAFYDQRFTPLQLREMSNLDLEISVLTPLSPADPDQIKIGYHGLVIELGENKGLLLPQVASERGWDPNTFLEHTCKKAGLEADAWRDPAAELFWFGCDVYHERDVA